MAGSPSPPDPPPELIPVDVTVRIGVPRPALEAIALGDTALLRRYTRRLNAIIVTGVGKPKRLKFLCQRALQETAQGLKFGRLLTSPGPPQPTEDASASDEEE